MTPYTTNMEKCLNCGDRTGRGTTHDSDMCATCFNELYHRIEGPEAAL